MTVLKATVPPKGYMAHVLGYTLHSLLAAVADHPEAPGALDESVEPILGVLEADILGYIAEEKEVGGAYEPRISCSAPCVCNGG